MMSGRWIEDYSFGKIVIDGRKYTDDVILLGKEVKQGWWRKSGHRLHVEDLKDVIEFDPDILIIGTGSGGNMTVPANVERELDFEVKSFSTKKACKVYNKELKSGKKVAGGFHLTC